MALTLVVSDIHAGAYGGAGVLEHPAVRSALFERLAAVDRLVVLGDLLELGEGRPTAEVMAIAVPLLDGIARTVGEVVLVPGNHDRLMIRSWLLAQGDALALENVVPNDASPLLAEVTDRLAAHGAEVSVHYPGYRLSESMWMTHGHYLDHLLVPPGPYGMFRRPPRSRPAAYEARGMQARRSRRMALAQALVHPRIAPLTSAVLDHQMRHHSMPALAAALGALGVRAEHVVFGHVHRLGPLARDRSEQWHFSLAPDRAPTRFLNTGSWQQETLLIGRAGPTHPYWPGGAVLVGEDGIPHARNLLAEMGVALPPVTPLAPPRRSRTPAGAPPPSTASA